MAKRAEGMPAAIGAGDAGDGGAAPVPPLWHRTDAAPIQASADAPTKNCPSTSELFAGLVMRAMAAQGRRRVACCVSPLHPWTPRLVAAPDHVFALPTSFKVISHPCGTLPRPAPAPSLKWLLQLQSSSSWKTTGATAASTMCFRLLKSIISCAANGHSRA